MRQRYVWLKNGSLRIDQYPENIENVWWDNLQIQKKKKNFQIFLRDYKWAMVHVLPGKYVKKYKEKMKKVDIGIKWALICDSP